MKTHSAIAIITLLGIFAQACAAQKEKASKDIPVIISDKNSRTPAQQKIDSRLLQAMLERQGKKIKGTQPSPVDVGADSKGNVLVDIDAKISDTLIQNIKALPATIISSFKEYNTIRAEVNFSTLEKIAAFEDVKFIQPAARLQTNSDPMIRPEKPVVPY